MIPLVDFIAGVEAISEEMLESAADAVPDPALLERWAGKLRNLARSVQIEGQVEQPAYIVSVLPLSKSGLTPRQLLVGGQPSDLYLIEDTRGKSEQAVFWRPDRCGYTTDILTAGHYTRTEAESQERSRPSDRARKLADLLPLSELHVERGKLR